MNKIKYIIIISIICTVINGLSSEQIDDFSYINNWMGDPNDKPEIIHCQIQGNSLNMKYDFTKRGDTYIVCKRDFSCMDLRKADAIRFVYKGLDSSSKIQLKLEDSDTTVYGVNIIDGTPLQSWKTKLLKFRGTSPDFQYFWTSDESKGDKFLNLARIKKISFVITPIAGQGSGTVYLDNLEIWQTLGVPAEEIVIDNFNDGNMNNNDGNTWQESGGGSLTTILDNSAVYSGDYSLKLTYNAFNDYIVLYSALNNHNIAQYDCISFYVKGSAQNEQMNIKLKAGDEVIVWPIGGITDEWTYRQIDLVTMAERENRLASILTNAQQIEIAFQTNHRPQQGTIWIDELKFEKRESLNTGRIHVIDDFDDDFIPSWHTDPNENDPLTVSQNNGFQNKAMKIDYAFVNGSYFALTKPLSLNLYKNNLNTIGFYYKGKGANNNFDFKIYDSKDIAFHKLFYNFTDTKDSWQKVSFDLTDMASFSQSEGEKSLKLYDINKIEFVVIQNDADNEGEFSIRDLHILPLLELDDSLTGYKILRRVHFSQLPFDPGTGELSIEYSLKQSAQLEIYIFDTAGNMVYDFTRMSFFNNEIPKGDYELKWDGKNQWNKQVENGLYLFQIKAENNEHKEQYIKVLPVIR